MKDIIIKSSKIGGLGVFANKLYQKGEVVFRWNPRALKESELDNLLEKEKNYVMHTQNKYLFMQPPERYVNHSCDPNTKVDGFNDVAIRTIKKSEEITSDYGEGSMVSFVCRCGSPNCKHEIK